MTDGAVSAAQAAHTTVALAAHAQRHSRRRPATEDTAEPPAPPGPGDTVSIVNGAGQTVASYAYGEDGTVTQTYPPQEDDL